jgi:hypothetical protein
MYQIMCKHVKFGGNLLKFDSLPISVGLVPDTSKSNSSKRVGINFKFSVHIHAPGTIN